MRLLLLLLLYRHIYLVDTVTATSHAHPSIGHASGDKNINNSVHQQATFKATVNQVMATGDNSYCSTQNIIALLVKTSHFLTQVDH